MMIFFIFENFSENRKNWSFRPRPTFGPLWLNSHMCNFSIQMSEFLYFSCPGVKIWIFSFIFENFSKNQQNWSFRPLQTWGPFWINSHMYTLSIQMSEFLYFSCPGAKIWWFSSFSKNFRNKKLKFSSSADLGTFLAQSTHVHIVHPNKWFFLCFSCPGVKIRWYSKPFRKRKLFEKSKTSTKLKFLPTTDLGTFFGSIHTCAHFSIQMSEFLYFSYHGVKYDDFLHFRKPFQKLKKLKFLPTAGLGTFLA